MKEKYEVVISGVAGVFPECRNVYELEEALFKKTHLVTNDTRKWEPNYDFPKYCGNAFSSETFDAIFFNVPFNLPSSMDTITKQSLEISVEAIFDAGLNPRSLAGTRTAVYSTYEFSEAEITTTSTERLSVLVGTARTFTANRLSFALNLRGPSYTLQGGYGAAFHLMNHAKSLLEDETIDAAIIVCANALVTARALAIFNGMGLAAKDGKCRAFDKDAQGFALSESCVAFFLQRAPDARRNWATVIGADHRLYGSKPGNFIAFDGQKVKQTLRHLYSKWNIDPATVNYIEADGSGVKDRDEEEVNVISDVFCRGRKDPLLIGSVKSNMGHAESAACGAGTVKALITLKNSLIPPNIHLSSPIPTITSKGIQVVTEATPFKGDLVAINAIGLTGHFGHLLLQMNSKKTSIMKINEFLPQILFFSSRTEKGIEQIMQRVKSTKVTPEFAGLVNGIFSREVKHHMYRGYAIVPSNGQDIQCKTKRIDGSKKPIWWVFSGMGSQWNGMGSQLLHIPIFRNAIDRCDKVLKPHGVDIFHILTTDDESLFDNILNAFVGITAVQIGLVEVLKALELEPDGIIGHSVGELGCAYSDNCFTLEQTILAAHARGRASLEAQLIKGMMAAVGLGHQDIISMLPETVDVACRNSDTSCTISGPAADVEKFVAELKSKGIFARSVNVANIAYHSRYIQPAAPILLKYLREVIPHSTERSNKWISSSVPKKDWGSDLAKYCSPEYHTNNLLSPVLFENVLRYIPSNAVLLEIAPHGLLQAILKRAVHKTVTNIPLTHKSSPDAVKFLLDAVGQSYFLGFEPNVTALYPPIEYPVPCDTPSIQPFVTWDHSEKYGSPPHVHYGEDANSSVCERAMLLKKITNFLRAYQANGSTVSPLAFLLVEIWKIRAEMENSSFQNLPVVFEDIQIYSKLDLVVEDPSYVYLSVLPGSGGFTVIQVTEKEQGALENSTTLLRGNVRILENPNIKSSIEASETSNEIEKCSGYSSLEIGDQIQAVSELGVCNEGLAGKIRWRQDWVQYLDAVINVSVIKETQESSDALEPYSIQFIYLVPDLLETKEDGSEVEFLIDSKLRRFQSEGVLLDSLKTKRKIENEDLVETLQFVPYGETSFANRHDFLRQCIQVIVENSISFNATNGLAGVKELQSRHELTIEKTLKKIDDVIDSREKESDSQIEFAFSDQIINQTLDSGTCLPMMLDENSNIKLSCSENKGNIYLLTVAPSKKFKDVSNRGYSLIFEQAFNKNRIGFFKKVISDEKPRTYLVTKNWRETLRTLKLDGHQPNGTIFLVLDGPLLASPFSTLQDLLIEIGALDVRLYIILDDDAPRFSPNADTYKPQIPKDLVVNVLKGGLWGCYRRHQIPKTVLSHVFPALPFVDHATSKVDIRYIGLNETDCEASENEAAILDYSGVTASGDCVMGIASKKSGFGEKIELDPIFQWKIPTGMSLEDAAGLPFAYLMATLMLRDSLKSYTKKRHVLIHSGHTPIGSACITVALNDGHIVYTTVPDDVSKEEVASTFPQIPKSHITNYNQNNFFVPLMTATNGEGADVIISDLPRDKFLASWSCAAALGDFYNLNGSVLANNAPLPMSPFLWSVSFFSFTKADIIALSPDRRLRLYRILDDFLKSGKIANTRGQTLKMADIYSTPGVILETVKTGAKVVLKLSNCRRVNTHGKKNGTRKFTVCGPVGNYLVICPTVSKSTKIVKWLLQIGATNITIATIHQSNSTAAAKELNGSENSNNATILIASGAKANSLSDAKNLLEQVSKRGEVAAIFAVALDKFSNIVRNVKQAAKDMNLPGPVIYVHSKDSTPLPEVISVTCDGNVDYASVLSHALENPDRSAAYVVSEKSKSKDNLSSEQSGSQTDEISEYLPSSVEELAEMGGLLCQRDIENDSQIPAKFIRTVSLAPGDELHKDVRPVFIIPAFGETQMRPLISKIMYPCFVAHFNASTSSVNQVTSNLLKSMMKIQKKGPFTIVAETWSGGIGMALSKLISDSGHEVSLFLLHGVPKSMLALLPPKDSLSKYLKDILFGKTRDTEGVNGVQSLNNVINSLPACYCKPHVERAFTAIQKSLAFLRACEPGTQQKYDLFLLEMEKYHVSGDDVGQMSMKSVKLVKSKSKTYKELLEDPFILATIAKESPFSWAEF